MLALYFKTKLIKIGPIELELFKFKIGTFKIYTLYNIRMKIQKDQSHIVIEKKMNIVGSQFKNLLPAAEFDNLGINIELHSRTIKSFHGVAMNYS